MEEEEEEKEEKEEDEAHPTPHHALTMVPDTGQWWRAGKKHNTLPAIFSIVRTLEDLQAL